MEISQTLAQLVVILIAASIGAEIMHRLKQPPVLGELVAGVLVGVSWLRWVTPGDPIIHTLMELGAILLLFEVGLESDLGELLRVGVASAWVAVAGVILPFGLGLGVARLMGLNPIEAVFVGATLCATSVGITARVFSDLGLLRSVEAQTVLGAAVIDDILGLIILAVVSGMAAAAVGAGTTPGISEVAMIFARAFVFVAGSILAGAILTPLLMKIVQRFHAPGALGAWAIGLCFGLSALSALAGLHPIVGAFAAGLVLAGTENQMKLRERVTPIAGVMMPIFFVAVGAQTDIHSINPLTVEGLRAMKLMLALSVAAVIGKLAGGLTLPFGKSDRLAIGYGMIPRGEVGLIFASVGAAKGILSKPDLAAVIGTVMITTLITPPLLAIRMKRTYAQRHLGSLDTAS